jgi:hypothetical protein
MRLVHATDKTWYNVLYHHTMYVINLSNISIKTNFKQIARVELKCVQYSEGDYILCLTSCYFFRSFTNVRLLCFVSHSNGMTSCQSSSTENVSRNVAPFFYHHNVVIQHLLSNDKKFCFSLIGLNSIFSTLPQSEYTSRAVSIPRVQWVYLACSSEYTSRAVSIPRVQWVHLAWGIFGLVSIFVYCLSGVSTLSKQRRDFIF